MPEVKCPCMEREGQGIEDACGATIEDTMRELMGDGYCWVPILTAAIRSVGVYAGQVDPQLPEPHRGNLKQYLLDLFEKEYTNGQARHNSDNQQQHAY